MIESLTPTVLGYFELHVIWGGGGGGLAYVGKIFDGGGGLQGPPSAVRVKLPENILQLTP